MDRKCCSCCGEEKSQIEFPSDHAQIDDYFTICSDCRARSEARDYGSSAHVDFKRCNKCKEIKPLSDFNRRSVSKDGYHPRCKKCVTEARGRVYREPEHLPDGYRRCTTCKQLFPATSEFFYAAKGCKYGLRPDCKKCNTQRHGQWQRANAERVNEKNRRWRVRHPEQNREITRKSALQYYYKNRDTVNEKSRQWRQANKDKVRAMEKAYANTNRDKIRERRRKYRENNPDKIKIHRRVGKQRRRAQLRKLPNTFKAKDWRIALYYWEHRCAICGRTEGSGYTLAPDHWIPVSYKGNDNPGTVATNILPLCHGIKGCNNEKFNHNPGEWLIEKIGEEAAIQKLAEIEIFFEHIRNQGNK